jgi:DNA-binding NarL/FixJ family response regulator
VTDLLPQVSCPTLVMHATREQRVPSRKAAHCRAHSRRALRYSGERQPHPARASRRAPLAEEGARVPSHASGRCSGELTSRERDLLELIAQGRDNAEIAEQFRLRTKTVRNHITSIFAKLEVSNRAQAIVSHAESGFGTSAPRSQA